MNTEGSFKKELRDWIVVRNQKIAPEDFDDDTPLIQERIITSLQVLDLVLFLEELTGSAVDVEQLKPGAFRSVNVICASFGPGGQRGG